MKKLLALLLVLGAAGFLVYRYVLTSAPERSCERLATLCGQKDLRLEGCVRGMSELGKTNKEAASKFETCVSDAKTCGEGAGCLVGAGLNAAGGVLNDFIKGIGHAIGK
jgi:hypothetical protein